MASHGISVGFSSKYMAKMFSPAPGFRQKITTYKQLLKVKKMVRSRNMRGYPQWINQSLFITPRLTFCLLQHALCCRTSSRPGYRSLSLGTNVKVGIVEVVADIPSQHLELLALQQNCMEPTQGEEQSPVLLNLLHAVVGLLRR